MSKVVVLDDNAVMRSVLSDIVAYLGHEVRTFGRVDPFLESLQEEAPDCLIVDAWLQDNRNGLEVIEQVRNLPGMQTSRYILLTASQELMALRSRLQQRQIALLTKPCSFEDLEMALV